MLTKRKKANAIKATQINDKDTGSAEVQASILTKRIDELADHLKKHKKDNHSRKGLLGMVAKRQKQLNYIKKKDVSRYGKLVDTLGLKNKA